MTTRRVQARHDYAPGVRQRPRPELPPLDFGPGRRPYTPSVRERPAETVLRTWVSMATVTTRETLLIGTTNARIRLVRVKVSDELTEAAARYLELYFGTGTQASTDRSKIIDILRIPVNGSDSTRTYDALSVGRIPIGLPNESISYRWRVATTNSCIALVEYVEDFSQGRLA